MSKKTIRNFAAIGFAGLILCIIFFVVASSTSSFLGLVAMLLAIICLIAAIIGGAVSYFGALVKLARMRRMGWFVAVLLLGVTGALIYGLAGPETQISDEAMSSFLYRSYKQTKKTMGYDN